jgi:hypothetical protein
MQFAIGMIFLDCYFVKYSQGPLGVKICRKEKEDFINALYN